RDMSRLALLLAVSVVILSFNFGSRLLLTNDDTRFPAMARDVLVHGHWLLPALPDGQPHLAKPPLVVWLMTLASWPTGSVSVRTAVLPSLLEALGVVLVTYWIGRRLFNPNVGLVGGLVTFTTVRVFPLAHSAMPDMALLLALNECRELTPRHRPCQEHVQPVPDRRTGGEQRYNALRSGPGTGLPPRLAGSASRTGLLGDGAPLSPTSIARLKAGRQAKYEVCKIRWLADLEPIYLWVELPPGRAPHGLPTHLGD